MKLKNILLVVDNIENSVKFYTELFGLFVLRDFGSKVILTEGLVLQERKAMEESIGEEIGFGDKSLLLYFEERNLDKFIDKINASAFNVRCLGGKITDECGRGCIHLYDPDGHLIEVGEPFN